MEGKVNWKNDIWNFLSNSDVDRCPLYGNCELMRNEGLCYGESNEILDSCIEFNINDTNNTIRNIHRCDVLKKQYAGKIYSLVEDLAAEFVTNNGISRPPIPDALVQNIDPEHAVEVRLIPLKYRKGALWYCDGMWIIQLNQNDPYESQRITLFHEVFHIFTYGSAMPMFKKEVGSGAFFVETLADFFASCVLMPKELVIAKWMEVRDINMMADIFAVCTECMYRRLLDLSLIE